ncbi:MAG: UvrD-helicase domain-containing protein, partial [Candidatus Izemoplasmatales bacterium]|nr:UvrD-helicase domain-containing protein [Candidatus Izemoplasmatales bacterium]
VIGVNKVILEQLNEQQKEAVQIVSGPIMAVAGAGSGKTRVLTNRIAYLIDEIGIPPSEILAITFTNRAADEMKRRVFDLIRLPLKGIWISTFHALGAKILRSEIHLLGYQSNFQIIDDDDSQIVVKNLLKEYHFDIKHYSPRQFASLIEMIKSDPQALSVIHQPVKAIMEEIYPAYCQFLKKNNLVDFQDLLVLVLELFQQHPIVLKRYQDIFRYVLVDEFQDTNDLQYELVYLLTNSHRNLFIVGDEDQSIYAFRGSNIENIRKFMRDFPGYHQVILNQNYRSTTNILNAANSVISHNQHRIPKELYSKLGHGEKVIHFRAQTDEEEAYYIYNKIKTYVKEGYLYSDFAVLYRNHAMSRRFEDLFLRYNIPHKVIGNVSFYKRKEIKDAIAYLRLLVDLGDDYAFSRIYNEPKRGIGNASFDRLKNYALKNDLKLMDAIGDEIPGVSSRVFERLVSLKQTLIELQREIEKVNLLITYDTLLEKTGYLEMLRAEDLSAERKLEAERRIDNLQEFKTVLLEKIKEYDPGISNQEKLVNILTELALREESEELLEQDEFISLMTTHSVKGLEFRVVFITCLEQTLFPSSQSLFELMDVEEERRLFYVGLTRAKEIAVLTSARQRYMYGRLMENQDSQFLSEIAEEYLERGGLAKPKDPVVERPKKRAYPPFEFTVKEGYRPSGVHLTIGDKIDHTLFGAGVVVALNDDKATIAFQQNVGIKVLMKDHPSIKKRGDNHESQNED